VIPSDPCRLHVQQSPYPVVYLSGKEIAGSLVGVDVWTLGFFRILAVAPERAATFLGIFPSVKKGGDAQNRVRSSGGSRRNPGRGGRLFLEAAE
jgi:hypothetical protein